jgi:hypothetical protein
VVANVFVLALAAAVYPTLLAGVIVILSRPNPLRLLGGFLLGGMTISIQLSASSPAWPTPVWDASSSSPASRARSTASPREDASSFR